MSDSLPIDTELISVASLRAKLTADAERLTARVQGLQRELNETMQVLLKTQGALEALALLDGGEQDG